MFRDVALSWTIVGTLMAGLFYGSYVSIGSANHPAVETAASTQHYVHRQTSATYQDQSGEFTVYVRAIAPRTGS